METLKEVTVWKLLFKTLALKSELFTPKINALFGVLIHNATPAFLGSVNSMLDQIITKKPNSIYLEVNNKSDLSD